MRIEGVSAHTGFHLNLDRVLSRRWIPCAERAPCDRDRRRHRERSQRSASRQEPDGFRKANDQKLCGLGDFKFSWLAGASNLGAYDLQLVVTPSTKDGGFGLGQVVKAPTDSGKMLDIFI
jgi:hypothetical protein